MACTRKPQAYSIRYAKDPPVVSVGFLTNGRSVVSLNLGQHVRLDLGFCSYGLGSLRQLTRYRELCASSVSLIQISYARKCGIKDHTEALGCSTWCVAPLSRMLGGAVAETARRLRGFQDSVEESQPSLLH